MVLSEYELSRQANIETNNRALAALGLLDEPLIPAAPKTKTEKKHKPKTPPSLRKERDQSARSAFLNERAEKERKIAEAARVKEAAEAERRARIRRLQRAEAEKAKKLRIAAAEAAKAARLQAAQRVREVQRLAQRAARLEAVKQARQRRVETERQERADEDETRAEHARRMAEERAAWAALTRAERKEAEATRFAEVKARYEAEAWERAQRREAQREAAAAERKERQKRLLAETKQTMAKKVGAGHWAVKNQTVYVVTEDGVCTTPGCNLPEHHDGPCECFRVADGARRAARCQPVSYVEKSEAEFRDEITAEEQKRAKARAEARKRSAEEAAEGWRAEGHEFLGERLRRTFGRRGDNGVNATVRKWLPEDVAEGEPALFRAVHDDGDFEDLEEDEVRDGMAAFAAVEGWKRDGHALLGKRVRRTFGRASRHDTVTFAVGSIEKWLPADPTTGDPPLSSATSSTTATRRTWRSTRCTNDAPLERGASGAARLPLLSFVSPRPAPPSRPSRCTRRCLPSTTPRAGVRTATSCWASASRSTSTATAARWRTPRCASGCPRIPRRASRRSSAPSMTTATRRSSSGAPPPPPPRATLRRTPLRRSPTLPIPILRRRYEVLEAMAAYDESAEAAAEALEGWRYDGHEWIGARVRRSYEKTKAISVRDDPAPPSINDPEVAARGPGDGRPAALARRARRRRRGGPGGARGEGGRRGVQESQGGHLPQPWAVVGAVVAGDVDGRARRGAGGGGAAARRALQRPREEAGRQQVVRRERAAAAAAAETRGAAAAVACRPLRGARRARAAARRRGGGAREREETEAVAGGGEAAPVAGAHDAPHARVSEQSKGPASPVQ